MRVAIDARAAIAARKTGVGYYTWHLVRLLPLVDPATHYIAWYLNAGGFLSRRTFFADVHAPNLTERGAPIPASVFNRSVTRFDLPRFEWLVGFDVAFGPNFVTPPTRSARVVVTVHDLGFRVLPTTAPHAVPWWLRGLERTLATATRVIVPSEATRRDLQELYGVETERIEVIPLGVDRGIFARASPDEVRAVRRRFGIDGPYMLVLGLDRRKNLPRLLEALGHIPRSDRPTLVLAGGAPWDPDSRDPVADLLGPVAAEIRARIVLTGYVPDRTKVALLSGAEALAYTSLYEGFGLPALEAMACGTPVLTSNVSALPELVDGAGVLVDPTDAEAIADAMTSLLRDDALRSKLGRAGSERADRYSWDTAARRTADVLRAAAEA